MQVGQLELQLLVGVDPALLHEEVYHCLDHNLALAFPYAQAEEVEVDVNGLGKCDRNS